MIKITPIKANTKKYRDLETGDVFEWGSDSHPPKARAIKTRDGMLWLSNATSDKERFIHGLYGLTPDLVVHYLGKIKEIIVEKE